MNVKLNIVSFTTAKELAKHHFPTPLKLVPGDTWYDEDGQDYIIDFLRKQDSSGTIVIQKNDKNRTTVFPPTDERSNYAYLKYFAPNSSQIREEYMPNANAETCATAWISEQKANR